ncbi:hypothetical protein HDU99_004505, partial [Rhizoclosmatium hyalinum]
FVVETGGHDNLIVQGNLQLVQHSETAITVTHGVVTVRGVLRSGGSEKETLNVDGLAFDSNSTSPLILQAPLLVTSGPLVLKTPHLIPFTVDLGSSGLMPSLRQLVEYSIHVAVSFISSLSSDTSVAETCAPLVVLPNERLRALVLASQAPLAVANGDDSTATSAQDDSVKFVLTVARRAVLAGDEFVAELNVESLNTQLNKVLLSLQARTTVNADDEIIRGPVETLVSIEDASLPANYLAKKLDSLAIDHTLRNNNETSRLITLAVPLNVPSSIVTESFSYEHHLRLEIFPEDGANAVAVVEVPVVIVERGSAVDANGIPQLQREVSLNPTVNESPVSQEEMYSSVIGQFMAYRSFRPINAGGDELCLNVGDTVTIKYIFSDGWAYADKSSGEKGFLQMHYVLESDYVPKADATLGKE